MLSSEQVRAARAILRMEQSQLAELSGVSLPSIKRLETQPGQLAAQERTATAIRTALENAGVTFLDEGDVATGPGVALGDTKR